MLTSRCPPIQHGQLHRGMERQPGGIEEVDTSPGKVSSSRPRTTMLAERLGQICPDRSRTPAGKVSRSSGAGEQVLG